MPATCSRGLFRLLNMLLMALLLGACGGGGGSPGTPGPVTPPPTAGGALNVTTSGLPAGIDAAVRVTGPGSYQQDLAGSQNLTGLASGSYTVSAGAVTSGGVTYQPAPATQTVSIAAGASANA